MATGTSFTANGQLQVLRDSIDSSQPGVDIVLIPGIGTSAPESWPFADQDWLPTVPVGAGTRIFAYQYTSLFSGNDPSWGSILMLGYDLLELMINIPSQSDLQATNKPILVVCHSLGGVILKQALCVANSQSFRYGSIVNAIAGVIFLSTPHRYGDMMTTLIRYQEILEATTGKTLRIPGASIEQEGAILVDLADRFEGMLFRIPILSVYELRESKLSPASLHQRYKVLVNREACSTRALLETVIGINLDHHDMCLFTKSISGEGLPEIMDLIHNTLQNAGDVAPRSEELEQLEYTEWPSSRATEGTSLSGFELVHPASPDMEAREILHLPYFLLDIHSGNRDFFGREDVLALLAAELLPSKNMMTAPRMALRQFSLCGFGGLGKTEIAREFCRRHRASFDAVFWVVADDVAKLDHTFQQISLALGLETPERCKSQVVSREIVKGWLSNSRKELSGTDEFAQPGQVRSEASWLLIFDNADDPMILADYWPQGSGSILVTSRDPLAKTMFTWTPSGLDLGPLSEQDSLTLFKHLTGISTDDNTARLISKALGGIPLAISQMAGIIRQQDLTLSEFFELYTDRKGNATIYETNFDSNLVKYPHSLSTVWAFEKLKPQARQLLELIAFLDPDVIKEDLLMEASKEQLSEGIPWRKSNYVAARTDLLQYSLIQRDKRNKQLSIHRVVQDVILAMMDIAKKQLLFDQTVRLLWTEWPSAMPQPSKESNLPQPKSVGGRLHVARWPICEALYPHVLRIYRLWSATPDLSEATRLLFAKLLSEAAWYQKERGRTEDLHGFFETAFNICESSTHTDRDSLLADIYFCLGSIAMDTSDFDASRIYKELSFNLVSEICAKLGTEDERLYLAYAERGISRIQDGRYREGEADLKEALRMRKSFGNYIPRSGEANLSWALLAQGKFEECNMLLLNSLAGREKALGENDRESARTGLIFYALGNLRAAQEQWDESFKYHQRAWRHMRATVGDRDFYTANVSHKIAEHLIRLGRNEEAIAVINEALDVWSVDPNARKNEIARTTFLKGKFFEEMGKTQKASAALKLASRLRKEITKEDRDAMTLTMNDFDEIVAFWAR
ncbi:hypothetical protein Plec18167_002066 [Paecilomyces lecythidis]|uniref:DUF7779 domain-containing protein n=1 Tax=Paecilomyces lecythidis TaxID=3004212 RepID=A0ABR3Y841_9EURO